MSLWLLFVMRSDHYLWLVCDHYLQYNESMIIIFNEYVKNIWSDHDQATAMLLAWQVSQKLKTQ